MGKDEFLEFLKEASNQFKDWVNSANKVLVVSHIDADGLSSAILFTVFLYENEKTSEFKFVKYLDKDKIKELLNTDSNLIIFLDLGSAFYREIKKYSFGKRVLIIDHHELNSKEKVSANVLHINPRLFGLNGTIDISSSGISYLFLKNISYSIFDVSYLSLVGALGDIQEVNGEFKGLNKEILNDLVENGIIEIKKGLKIFGIFTRPLYKALEYSTEIIIPGVTGSETGAIKLLQEVGIPLKKGGDWTKYSDLQEEDVKKLVTSIILRRLQAKIPNAEDILGNLYILKNSNDPFFKELREIAYLLNACGRLGKYSIAIGSVLGDEKYKDMLLDVQLEYKKEVLKAIQLLSTSEIEKKEYGKILIINYKDKIRDTLVSPIASIVSSENYFPNYKIIIVCAKDDKGLKLSIRSNSNIDLSKIVSDAAERVNGVGGGHDVAAGASIPENKLEDFIKELRILLKQHSIVV